MLIEDIQREIKGLTRNFSVVQETPDEMSFYFTPKGCNCGGVDVIYGLPNNYEAALLTGLERARTIASQGFHNHYSKKVKNKN